MKPSFKDSVKIYRKNFWKFFLIDLIFLLAGGIFYLYSRIKIEVYMLALTQYYEQMSTLQAALEQGSENAMAQLALFVEGVTPLLDKISLFMFFVVPAVLFVLWCFFQSMHYNLIFNKKIFNWRKLLVFGAVTLPFFVVLMLLADKFIDGAVQLLVGGISLWTMIAYAVIGLLLIYLLQVVYSLYLKVGLVELVNQSLVLAFWKFHKIFFIVLAYMFVFIFVVSSLAEAGISAIGQDYTTMAFALAVLAAALLVLGFLRTFLAVYVRKLGIP
ncbi:MAG: hypothetical protein ABIB71_01960 [Candidatus Woesearchaeota archaeon]